MTIDQISETLGSIKAHLEHQTDAIDKLQASTSQMQEGMIRGAARMTAIEDRQDRFEEHVAENISPHVDDYRSNQERKKGAIMLARTVWISFGAGITTIGGFVVKAGIAVFGASH